MRRAYEALERAEAALEQMRQSRQSGTYVRDTLSGGYWSPEVFEMFGLDRTEIAPPLHVWAEMLPGSDFSRVITAAQRAYQERRPFQAEYRIRLRNGAQRFLRSHALPVVEHLGHDFALVGVVTDVTAEIRAMTALRAAAGKLRRAISAGESADGAAWGANGAGERDRATALDARAWKIARGGMAPFRLRRTLRLIEERLPAGISVAEMARETGLSATRFARVFKEVTGETPHQFLLRRRLERASAELFRASGRTIAEIAVESGFFDQAHFTRHFRKAYGTTPGEVLRRARRTCQSDAELFVPRS